MRISAFVSAAIAFISFSLLLSSCGSSRHASARAEGKELVHQVEKRFDLSKSQKKIIEEACTWLGTPYAYAKQDKGKGTDCSGMVMEVYLSTLGCKLPRNSAKQADFCIPLDESDAVSGDLVFFATGKDPNRISHVGIVIDNDNFIHASTSKGVVISKLHTPYYTRTLMMYGRVPESRAEAEVE